MKKTKDFLESVCFIMRTGAQWIEFPKYYGLYKTIHRRFIHWSKKEIWNRIHSCFAQDCEGKSFLIDGSVIRAHACASGYWKNGQEEQALGR